MNKTALVILEYKGTQIVELLDVTTLDIINSGTSIVEVNGVKIIPNQQFQLVRADGTLSDVKLDCRYTNNDDANNRFQIIYKKLKG